MAKPDGRIEKGQRIASAISAKAWNRAQDAADIVLGVRPGVEAGQFKEVSLPFSYIYSQFTNKGNVPGRIWNVGCLDIPGSILLNPPNETDTAWNQVPAFANASSVSMSRVAIALEPIAEGAFGRVAISGIVPAKITVNQYKWEYAVPWFSRYTAPSGLQSRSYPFSSGGGNQFGIAQLETFPFAGYKVIWHQSPAFNESFPDTDVWALVDLSSFWVQPVVQAKVLTDFVSTSSGSSGYVELLYNGSSESSGIVVLGASGNLELKQNRIVWTLNPFSRSPHVSGGPTFGSLQQDSSWFVLSTNDMQDLQLQTPSNVAVNVKVHSFTNA